MAILAKGLLVLFVISSISAQYQSRKYHSTSSGFTPIILGHRQDDQGLLEGHYQHRYVNSPLKTENVRLGPGVVKEFNTDDSDEEDGNNREYTVGAHFQVTHPTSHVTTPKDSPLKIYDPSEASYSYTNFHLNGDKKFKPSPAVSFKSKLNKKPLFKPAKSTPPPEDEPQPIRSPGDPIDFYELPKGIDQDPRDFKPNFKLQDVPNLYPLQKKYRDVASKGQVEKYLEDQQKYLDEAIELQLLNDPNPATRGRYQQFLKSKNDERIEKEYEETLKKAPLIVFDESVPKTTSLHKFASKRPLKKTQLKGLDSYRTPKAPPTYHFSIDY